MKGTTSFISDRALRCAIKRETLYRILFVDIKIHVIVCTFDLYVHVDVNLLETSCATFNMI